ncbi:MAG: FAD-binding protein [Hyphomicrobiales bacterium]
MDSKQIVIAGGGIAGLAAALGVARLGQAALILEKSADFREVGAAVQVGPNAVRASSPSAPGRRWNRQPPQPEAIHIRDARRSASATGRSRRGFRQRFGAPYRVILRLHLQAPAHRGPCQPAH